MCRGREALACVFSALRWQKCIWSPLCGIHFLCSHWKLPCSQLDSTGLLILFQWRPQLRPRTTDLQTEGGGLPPWSELQKATDQPRWPQLDPPRVRGHVTRCVCLSTLRRLSLDLRRAKFHHRSFAQVLSDAIARATCDDRPQASD